MTADRDFDPEGGDPASFFRHIMALIHRALAGWDTTARAMTILITTLVVLVVGAGTFGMTIDIGPLHIAGR